MNATGDQWHGALMSNSGSRMGGVKEPYCVVEIHKIGGPLGTISLGNGAGSLDIRRAIRQQWGIPSHAMRLMIEGEELPPTQVLPTWLDPGAPPVISLVITGKRCRVCHRRAAKLQACAGCKEVFYCSFDCQRQEWEDHQKICTRQFQANDKGNKTECYRGQTK
jgi:hypothetical protein